MSTYVWISITSLKVMNIPTLLPFSSAKWVDKDTEEVGFSFFVAFDGSRSLAWILMPDVTKQQGLVSCWDMCTHKNAHPQIKIPPKNVQVTTFHHFSSTCLSLIFPSCTQAEHKVSGGLSRRWWMDVKCVIMDKQSLPGPTCCYILKNMPVTPTAEGDTAAFSHISPLTHSVSLAAGDRHIVSKWES